MLRRLYSLLMTLFSPFFLLYTLNKSRREPRYRRNWTERFGFAPRLKECAWIHCVSLGETIAAKPLILKLQEQLPNTPLLITNTTATGSLTAEKLLRDIDCGCFLPYDLPSAMRRFLKHTHPRVLVIMETELWPNLIAQTQAKNIPIILNNARLSEKSLHGYQRIGSLSQEMMQKLTQVNAQTQEDAQRFIQLGLAKEKAVVTGNIKFDLHVAEDLQQQGNELKASWHNRPTWIAASTHAGEEEIILQAHKLVLKQCQNALLVLVPRHPNRFDEVYTLCEKSELKTARYTQSAVSKDDAILLGDVVGKLMLFYAATDITFMGGSIAPIGGHNFIESAVLANPQISGPVLHNFQKISEQLLENGALTIADAPENIAQAVVELMQNTDKRQQQGELAKAMAMSNKGACEKQVASVLSCT